MVASDKGRPDVAPLICDSKRRNIDEGRVITGGLDVQYLGPSKYNILPPMFGLFAEPDTYKYDAAPVHSTTNTRKIFSDAAHIVASEGS